MTTTATHVACATIAKIDRRASQDESKATAERYHAAVRRLHKAALALQAAAQAFDRPNLDPADYPADGPLRNNKYYSMLEMWRDTASLLWCVENFLVTYEGEVPLYLLHGEG